MLTFFDLTTSIQKCQYLISFLTKYLIYRRTNEFYKTILEPSKKLGIATFKNVAFQ